MQEATVRLIKILLFNPASQGEMVVSALVAAFVFVVTVNAVGSALRMALAQSSRSLTVLVLGLIVNVSVSAFLYHRFSPPGWVLIGAAFGTTLLVVVPCMRFLQKGTYAAALVSLVLGVAGMLVAALLVHTAFNAISGGSRSVGKGLTRKRHVERAVELE